MRLLIRAPLVHRSRDVGETPLRIQDAFFIRNLLIRNLGADFQISWPGNRNSQLPKTPFLKWISCSLEREGWMTPRGGCRPPEPSRSRKMFLIFGLRNCPVSGRFGAKKSSMWTRLGGFLSEWRPVLYHSSLGSQGYCFVAI